jgi:nicotinamide mononucleotide adenylyltransferase
MSTLEYDTGVIHGRFQVLHYDHMKYLMAGKNLCRHLVVGITNPDPFLTKMENADTERNNPLANPLTYYERYALVNAALKEEGLTSDQFSVVPFPINFPDRYKYYVPMDAVFFLTIYDEWGKQKLTYFQKQGLKTHVLWDVPLEKKGLSAGSVRDLMIQEKPWEHLVPHRVAAILKEWEIPERLKKMAEVSLLGL